MKIIAMFEIFRRMRDFGKKTRLRLHSTRVNCMLKYLVTIQWRMKIIAMVEIFRRMRNFGMKTLQIG